MKGRSLADKTLVIAGGGPAGLTAAYLLSQQSSARIIVAEADGCVGGISRTVEYHGNRIDIGGHRFFSKSKVVNDLWHEILPPQTAPALDEILIGSAVQTSSDIDTKPTTGDSETDNLKTASTADPQLTDSVMLRRRRVSRILFNRRFINYPVSASVATLRALGLGKTFKAACGYLKARFNPMPETSLENFYINRFGRPLYNWFFEDYTTKVWGKHPSELSADWGAQRVKGLSVTAVLKNLLQRSVGSAAGAKVETSLIEEFDYPKFGPGQLWEAMAKKAAENGAEILLNTRVCAVHTTENRVTSVEVQSANGKSNIRCDYFLSSMPLKNLVEMLQGVDVPQTVLENALHLPYRDFITVGLLVDKLAINNGTRLKTFANRVPDTWIYIQDRDVKLGRLQIFNNWSPYMVKDFESTVWIGLEYFCNEGDSLWQMSDSALTAMASDELQRIGVIDRDAILDSVCIRMPKAYPAYFGKAYEGLPDIIKFLDTIPNLYCIGRNGQHRYNNMDHSMLTAREAVKAIMSASDDHSSVWAVNTEADYHETKRSES